MGMDVYGSKPTSEVGEYFRQTVWGWRPLADYVLQVAPHVAYKCRDWHTNSGYGLNAEDSKELARALQVEIDSGRAEFYVHKRNRELENLPSNPCNFCENGTTTQAVADKYPAYQAHVGKQCIQCKGVGTVRPTETWYGLSVETIQDFVNFMRDSGGFAIH